ncbi:hypothetical protein IQ225_17315, partial [Synechocystis salina LEGE 06155]|nr:hypothetical protein [Synechocystis salina LEGE 06155]
MNKKQERISLAIQPGHDQPETSAQAMMIPPQKQMTGMLGHPVAENPIDRMFDAV